MKNIFCFYYSSNLIKQYYSEFEFIKGVVRGWKKDSRLPHGFFKLGCTTSKTTNYNIFFPRNGIRIMGSVGKTRGFFKTRVPLKKIRATTFPYLSLHPLVFGFFSLVRFKKTKPLSSQVIREFEAWSSLVPTMCCFSLFIPPHQPPYDNSYTPFSLN